jgi:translation elongation factor aEF-1 beta
MGLVAATFKVMPENPGDTKRIVNEIKSSIEVKEIKEIPVGFGIKIIEVLLIFDDAAGIGSVEEKLRSIDGVASVESGDVTLL